MPNKKKGISLLEILIALTIISLAFLVISQGYASAFKIGKKSRGFTEATILGQNILEWYKNQDFDKLENLNPQQDPAIVISEHLKAWNCKIYTNIKTNSFSSSSKPILKQITLLITWDYEGKTQELTFIALKHRP